MTDAELARTLAVEVGALLLALRTEGRDPRELGVIGDREANALILARLENTWAGRPKAQRSQAWIDRQVAKTQASLKAMSQGIDVLNLSAVVDPINSLIQLTAATAAPPVTVITNVGDAAAAAAANTNAPPPVSTTVANGKSQIQEKPT